MAEKKTPEFDSSQASGSLYFGDRKTVLIKPWAFTGSARSILSGHKTVTMPLFAKTPAVSDINQRNIGDCSFLAALAAVLATPNGENNILGAISEIENDAEVKGPAVIVRLFDFNGNPHYIKLEKAVISAWGGNVEYHARLDAKIGCWPVFFEAAFTAFNLGGQLDPKFASYARINGASAQRVFRLLLGVNAIETPIHGATSRLALEDRDSQMEQTRANLAMLLSGSLQEQDGKILQEIFGSNYRELFRTWNDWRCHQKDSDLWSKLDNAIQLYTGQKVTIATKTLGFEMLGTNTTINAGKVFRFDQFGNFYFENFRGLATPVRVAIYNYAKKVFPDKRGTGRYNLYQKRLFELMKAKHSAGDPMVVSSNLTYMGRTDKDKFGHSAGEPVVKGLVGKHSYAVLMVSEVSDGRCWIRIANPWGQTGRASMAQLLDPQSKYTLSKEGARQQIARIERHENDPTQIPPGAVFEIEEAVFDLDLDDLTKRFTVLAHLT